jgi:hypothetical protein
MGGVYFVRGDKDQLFKRHGASERLLLSTPIGSAAMLIGGCTIHAVTFLPLSKYPSDQKRMAIIWRLVRYQFIRRNIDGIAQVSPLVLSRI